MDLYSIVRIVFQVIYLLLFARIILSFIPIDNQVTRAIYELTEPIMAPFRRLIPPIGGTLDISPIILFMLLNFIQSVVLKMLR